MVKPATISIPAPSISLITRICSTTAMIEKQANMANKAQHPNNGAILEDHAVTHPTIMPRHDESASRSSAEVPHHRPIKTSLENLKVKVWNVNGLPNSRGEVEELLQRYHVDVALVKVTHLKDIELASISDFEGYFKNRRNCRGGGTAICIKRNISHSWIETPQLPKFEATIAMAQTEIFGQSKFKFQFTDSSIPYLSIDLNEFINMIIRPTVLTENLNVKNTNWGYHSTIMDERTLHYFLDQSRTNIKATSSATHNRGSRTRSDILNGVSAKGAETEGDDLQFSNKLSSNHPS